MKAPSMAPAALGGSIVVGVASMLIGGYRVADCIRFQTSRGECTQQVEDNTLAIVAGVAALAGAWGGFNTLNTKLDRPIAALQSIAPRGLVTTAIQQAIPTVRRAITPEPAEPKLPNVPPPAARKPRRVRDEHGRFIKGDQ
jgi:hypothetical protein